jgi:hypothetical protein
LAELVTAAPQTWEEREKGSDKGVNRKGRYKERMAR